MATPSDSHAPAPLDLNKCKVFVTGSHGFLGSNFINTLFRRFPAVQIHGIDFMSDMSDSRNVSENPRFKFAQGDITQSDLLLHLLNEYQPDVIIHFAAMEHVDTTQFGNSVAFTQNNVYGTHNVLECCRQYMAASTYHTSPSSQTTPSNPRLRRFIHVSTDEVYGRTRDGAYSEESILAPKNPYAASRAAAEALVWSYFKSFKVPAVIARICTVYGPQQYPDKVLPRFICQLAARDPIVLEGGGSSCRSMLYVDDCTDALALLAERGSSGEWYNIGAPQAVSIAALAAALVPMVSQTRLALSADHQKVLEGVLSPTSAATVIDDSATASSPATGSSGPSATAAVGDSAGALQKAQEAAAAAGCPDLVQVGPSRGIAHERPDVAIPTDKITALGWSPRVTLDDGLKRTVTWYLQQGIPQNRWNCLTGMQMRKGRFVKSKTGSIAGGGDSRTLRG
eukprot:TRINITY_DN5239_c0_g1_i1.p2 TRINITY_DN5239_c0_g1~~TRINITY_DN5239_c0_g1_i1.p2  ORF type:complete len:453 (+),score=94.34 TRINITY_DN5239_c0_g1_i1:115-1473(+)